MVFVLPWISFYRTNTIRILSIYLSIYLLTYDRIHKNVFMFINQGGYKKDGEDT